MFRRPRIDVVEDAVKAAMHPTDKVERPRRVLTLADAITKAAAPPFDRKGKPDLRPIPSREIAVKAASLMPSGGVTPEAIELAMHRQGIDFAEPFAPGKPLVPYYGFDKHPVRWNYLPGRNITTSIRDDRIPFATLKQIIDGYDVAQTCVRHTINDLRSMPLEFRPVEGHMKDAAKAIEEAKRFLRRPDGFRPFVTWFAQWARDVFRYDAGCLWKEREHGKVKRLKVVHGTEIMPIVDYYGEVPDPPAPAFQQVREGMPWIDFTRDDLIYLPQWPMAESVYGEPAIETVMLNANTDVRLQMFFLGFFSEGTVPEMLLTAPEDMSSPDDLAELQETWDDWYANNQQGRHGARWIPAGSQPFPYKQIQQLNPKIAEYVMRRTCAAFGRTPQDLGITDTVNRANSDTQVDVEFRISTVPNTEYFEAILNGVIQDDLQLPVCVSFDDGREKEDRLVEAQAHQIYIQMGAESSDEVRSNILGLPVDNANPVPRMFDSARLGPIPLSFLYAASGEVDPRTLSPLPGQQGKFVPVENLTEPLGVNQDHAAVPTLVGGVSGRKPNTPRTPKPPTARKSELETFAKFIQSRSVTGRWQPFHFETADERTARELNRAGRAAVARTSRTVICGGLAVVAQDTGRMLMLQRGEDPSDPAAGMWEFPGGHMEGGETPKQAAYREWQEETGILLPYVQWEPDVKWVASNGIYEGFVWLLPSEDCIDLGGRHAVVNPDDPDGDVVEAIAWWDRKRLITGVDVRPELREDLPRVLSAIDSALSASKSTDPNQRSRPKSRFEQALVTYWSQALRGAVRLTETPAALAARLFGLFSVAGSLRGDAVTLAAHVHVDREALTTRLHMLYADSFLAGAKDAADDLGSEPGPVVDSVDWDAWRPGRHVASNLLGNRGFAELLADDGVTIQGIDDTTRTRVGEAVARSIENGESVDQAASRIDQVLGDPIRSHLIAVTEINRAMTAAAFAAYRPDGEWDLVTAPDPCPICAGIKASNPHPMSDRDRPPIHPNCRCAVSEHVEG